MVELEPMNEEDFQASKRRGISRDAELRVRLGLWASTDAETASAAEYEELLPQGRKTPHCHFCNILDECDGSRIGETWYNARTQGGKTQFWINWIWVDPSYRRRGYATQLLQLFERLATEVGADRVSLHVEADNAVALALYAKLGYRTTDLNMAKILHPPL
jgi:RimJ/RimL family protein N-acetyltransferase